MLHHERCSGIPLVHTLPGKFTETINDGGTDEPPHRRRPVNYRIGSQVTGMATVQTNGCYIKTLAVVRGLIAPYLDPIDINRSAFHDEHGMFGIANVLQWVSGHGNNIRRLASLKRTGFRSHT